MIRGIQLLKCVSPGLKKRGQFTAAQLDNVTTAIIDYQQMLFNRYTISDNISLL